MDTVEPLFCIIGVLYIFSRYLKYRQLNGFPGPFIARWTTLYKEYYETVHADWVGKVEKLHQQYGPIVRVGPNELHFSDPEAYSDIYAVGSKFKKDPDAYSPVATFLHLFGILDPHEALTRRSIIQPYFSKRSVLGRESVVQEKVDSFIHELLDKYTKDKEPMDLEYTFRPFYAEVIPLFCFPDLDTCTTLASSGLVSSVKHAPDRTTIWFLMKNLPPKVVQIISGIPNRVDSKETEALQLLADDALNSSLSDVEEHNANFFHNLLQRSETNRPPQPRRWLAAEATNLKFAGVDTTANVVFIAIRAVLGSREILGRLVRELNDAWPDLGSLPPSLTALEKLPYLTAVIKEGLRLSMGVVAPMTRVVSPDTTSICGELIPEGTVVGMSNCLLHLNSDIFPEPHAFKPERWLQDDSSKLDKYLVTFARGPRSCVGMHFAWCMMYILMANVFRKLEFYPTSMEDLRAPYRLKDDFVGVYDGKTVYVHVEAKRD
ncbi:hypothetical protein V5O48_011259 [Marasmius crinis-equi]|uniref:Cytochrome P450 n=1 Tax=Marasmius crinis-equi TaxID=585013 RepID=A0ABR3F638_9AGAR